MEFVKVTFPTIRTVQMDGAPEGQTGDLIGVQRGHHIFDLGVPLDYTPPSRTEVVAGTSQDWPMIIEFGSGSELRNAHEDTQRGSTAGGRWSAKGSQAWKEEGREEGGEEADGEEADGEEEGRKEEVT